MTVKSIVDMALISGFIPLLAIEYTIVEIVSTPFPAVKNDMAKSSMDMVKAKRRPETIPGFIYGSITCLTVLNGPAPKSIAASGKPLGMVWSLGQTESTT